MAELHVVHACFIFVFINWPNTDLEQEFYIRSVIKILGYIHTTHKKGTVPRAKVANKMCRIVLPWAAITLSIRFVWSCFFSWIIIRKFACDKDFSFILFFLCKVTVIFDFGRFFFAFKSGKGSAFVYRNESKQVGGRIGHSHFLSF